MTEGNKLSALGANPSIPDMTAEAQRRHEKHLERGGSYPGMAMVDYVEKSGELARSRVDGDIVGYRGKDGCIVRYNKDTNDWVKAYTTGVASMYKPLRGENYYNDRMKDDGGVTND
jgi:hypothetical protein